MTVSGRLAVCAARFRLSDNVKNICDWIDHGSSDDTDVGLNVGASGLRRSEPGLAWGDQVLPPVRVAGASVGVKSVNGIVGRGGEDHIVRPAPDREIGNPERLTVSRSVDGTREELSERGALHVGGCECVFLRIDAVTREI